MCDAVAYVHRNLIIHRDIKPSNILVDTGGRPKLLDFGIAKILAAATDQTRTQERVLTPDYASPEQVRGAVQGTATDVYSLGAVLYKLLTGVVSVSKVRAALQLRQLSRQLVAGIGRPQLHFEIYIQYLESLRPEARNDKKLTLEIGAGYLHLARIQGVPEWNQLGQYAEAEKSLSKAEEIARTVLAGDPTDREALWQVANVAHDRAVVGYAERRPEDVAAWSPKSSEGFERLARLGNLTRREINGATYIYGDLAEIHIGLHRFQDAVRYAQLAIDYSRNSSNVPGPRAQAFNMLAGALTSLGDLQGAQQAVRQARLLYDQLFHDEGEIYYTQLIRYQTRCREGLLLGEDGGINLNRPEEAAIRLWEAFDALESAAKPDPNSYEARTTIATAGHYLGDLLRRTNPKGALEVYDHSLMR